MSQGVQVPFDVALAILGTLTIITQNKSTIREVPTGDTETAS